MPKLTGDLGARRERHGVIRVTVARVRRAARARDRHVARRYEVDWALERRRTERREVEILVIRRERVSRRIQVAEWHPAADVANGDWRNGEERGTGRARCERRRRRVAGDAVSPRARSECDAGR